LEKIQGVDTTRVRIEAELRRAPAGLDVAELASRLGVHANTVRWHLGALADAGRVSSAPRPRPGRGRPRVVYRAVEERGEGTRDEYRLLATVLSGAVADPRSAEDAGRSWGRYLVPRRLPLVRVTDTEATEAVLGVLSEQGFRPERGNSEICMHRCPFHDLAEAHPEVVCAVHKGLIDGALEELGSDLRIARLDVFVEPDLCVARLATSDPSEPSSRAAPAARA
jgi:predicted ArsR family transcriptional regulator